MASVSKQSVYRTRRHIDWSSATSSIRRASPQSVSQILPLPTIQHPWRTKKITCFSKIIYLESVQWDKICTKWSAIIKISRLNAEMWPRISWGWVKKTFLRACWAARTTSWPLNSAWIAKFKIWRVSRLKRTIIFSAMITPKCFSQTISGRIR